MGEHGGVRVHRGWSLLSGRDWKGLPEVTGQVLEDEVGFEKAQIRINIIVGIVSASRTSLFSW